MHPRPLFGAATVALLMLAGCLGSFEVQQTEPIRVQLDGDAERSTVRSDDEEPRQFVVDVQEREAVDVEVHVRSMAADQTTVRVEVQDGDDGTVLASKDIQVVVHAESEDGYGDANATDNGTSDAGVDEGNATADDGNATIDGGNETAEEAPTSDDATVVIENLYIDVRGRDNIVVLTQAVEGDADVQVQARDASGTQTQFEGNATYNATA